MYLKDDFKNLKFAMYCRKSTEDEDRQVQSIEDQERELNEIAKSYNLNIVKKYKESRSAKTVGRPEFSQMMNDINSKRVDAILCWKPNRLSRNMQDAGSIQFILQNKIIKSIVTPSKIYLPEDNTFILLIEFGIATEFSRGLSEDVKRGMQTKVNKGWRPMKAPIGYKNDYYSLKGEKKILKDEIKFPIIKKLWELLLTGKYSVKDIERIANDEYKLLTDKEKPMHTSNYYRIFNNIFYTGNFYYNGQLFKGSHEAMITTEEFEFGQRILNGNLKNNKRPKNKKLPYAGLIKCKNCGCSITAQEKFKKLSTGEIKSYIYHRCSRKKREIDCKQESIKYEDLKDQITNAIKEIELPIEFLEFAKQYLLENKEIEEFDNNKIIQNIETEINKLNLKLGNLFNLFIDPSNSNKEIITDEEYKNKKNEIQIEINKLEDSKNNLKSQNTSISNDNILDKLEFATLLVNKFNNANFSEQDYILSQISSKSSLYNGNLDIELASPFLTFHKKTELKEFRLELVNFVQSKTKIESFKTQFPVWSG